MAENSPKHRCHWFLDKILARIPKSFFMSSIVLKAWIVLQLRVINCLKNELQFANSHDLISAPISCGVNIGSSWGTSLLPRRVVYRKTVSKNHEDSAHLRIVRNEHKSRLISRIMTCLGFSEKSRPLQVISSQTNRRNWMINLANCLTRGVGHGEADLGANPLHKQFPYGRCPSHVPRQWTCGLNLL